MSCYGAIYSFRLNDFLATIDMEEVVLYLTSSYDDDFQPMFKWYNPSEVDLSFEDFLPATILYRHVATFSFKFLDHFPILSIDLFDMSNDDLKKLTEYLDLCR